MKPADRLIVALDGKPLEMLNLAHALYLDAGVRGFKVGVSALLDPMGLRLVQAIFGELLFLDLKFYDTRDTVDRTIRRAFDLGARFVTVHATPSVMEAAMRAKPNDERCKVLAVGSLTDSHLQTGAGPAALLIADGLVCPAHIARSFRKSTDKLLVCPGIRTPKDYTQEDNHAAWFTPAEALRAGADYLVVGRPIYAAADPIAAARAIIAEMEAAEASVPHGTNSLKTNP